ncbi:hypothetical protein [Runella sp.]|uniref:hypothetical protein n=1 Tax=Runella sp. TaxID=1960881 RepID=UPI00301B3B82
MPFILTSDQQKQAKRRLAHVNLSFAPIDPVPISFYCKWRDEYLNRNANFHNNNGSNDVDLSNEDLAVIFNAKKVSDLIKDKVGQYLTVHFMCNDKGKKFNKLTAGMCVLGTGQKPNSNTQYLLPNGNSGVKNAEKQQFADRNIKIGQLGDTNFNDMEAISHLIDTKLLAIFKDFETKGNKVKVIFAKIPANEQGVINGVIVNPTVKDKLIVIFAPNSFDENIKESDITPFSTDIVYDFGSGCCPPA